MSDSEQESLTSVELPALPEKKKRVVTEKHRAALLKNIEKARIVRAAQKVDRLKGEDEDKRLLREMLEEKKAAKKATTKKEAEPKTKEEPKEESEEEELESEEEEEGESESDSALESESDSSASEAEFVLKKRKAPLRKPAVKPKAKETDKLKKKGKSGKKAKDEEDDVPKRSKLLEQMEVMAAELKALKKKEKSSKVNVYVNQPEKKGMSDAKRKELLDI